MKCQCFTGSDFWFLCVRARARVGGGGGRRERVWGLPQAAHRIHLEIFAAALLQSDQYTMQKLLHFHLQELFSSGMNAPPLHLRKYNDKSCIQQSHWVSC